MSPYRSPNTWPPTRSSSGLVGDLVPIDLARASWIVVLTIQLVLQDALLFTRFPGIRRRGRWLLAELHTQLLKASLIFSPASFRLDLA